jgi:hypothetical protein
MNNLNKYIKLAKDNPKVAAGIIIVTIIILTWIF